MSGSFQKADGSGSVAARSSFRGSFIGGAIALTAPASGSISARGRGDKEARALGRQESRSGRHYLSIDEGGDEEGVQDPQEDHDKVGEMGGPGGSLRGPRKPRRVSVALVPDPPGETASEDPGA